jgi:hypothetical protein
VVVRRRQLASPEAGPDQPRFPDVVKATTPEGDTVYFDPKAAMRRKAKGT